MKKVIGGAIAMSLGVSSFAIFFPAFLNLLTATIPLMLISGGGLALYLKYEEKLGGCCEANDNLNTTVCANTQISTIPPETASIMPEMSEPEFIVPEPEEPEPEEPEVVEPEVVEPEVVEPEVVEPEPEEPQVVGPEPVETEPVETEVIEPEVVVTKPEAPLPVDKNTDTPKEEATGLLGNTSSLVFHKPDCQYSKSKNCTHVFSTREAAIQEGYKPCRTCNP